MPTRVTLRGHVLSTACWQTISRAVTSIKARWLKHRNTFGLGSSLSFDQTLKFPRRFESCLALMVWKSAAGFWVCFGCAACRDPIALAQMSISWSMLSLSSLRDLLHIRSYLTVWCKKHEQEWNNFCCTTIIACSVTKTLNMFQIQKKKLRQSAKQNNCHRLFGFPFGQSLQILLLKGL